jgi:hypothetical protein
LSCWGSCQAEAGRPASKSRSAVLITSFIVSLPFSPYRRFPLSTSVT